MQTETLKMILWLKASQHYTHTGEQHGTMLPSGVTEEVKLHLTGSFLYYNSFWLKAKLIKKTKVLGSKEL